MLRVHHLDLKVFFCNLLYNLHFYNYIRHFFYIFSGEDDKTSEIHLGRMLQILREFPDDPILSSYVIDDVWDDMKAMKVY